MASYHPDKQTPEHRERVGRPIPDGLPLPPADWLLHSDQLSEMISEQIDKAGGVVSFQEYMQAVLYTPGMGYYSAAMPKFGRAGDFVTAPELSPLFGACLAVFCERVFEQGCASNVLEFGAGSGKLCEQLLQHGNNINAYFILEVSADLKLRQQFFLEEVLPAEQFQKITWLDRLPSQFDGLVLANEVLDAMPVNVVMKQERWIELGVSYQNGQFDWAAYADDGEAVEIIERIEKTVGEMPEGYRTELNGNYRPWLEALAAIPGDKACLVIDYGDEQAEYYRPSRVTGSLRCYFQHRQHSDPFLFPGLQDITADVDFDAVADAAEMSGFELNGFATQGTFLLNHGLMETAQRMGEAASTVDRLALAQQLKSLTLPNEMGQRFKILLLTHNLQLQAIESGVRYG